MRRFLFAVAIAIVSFGSWGPLVAQEVVATVADADRGLRFFMAAPKELVPLDVARTPVLRRRVSLNIHRAPLRDVLDQIARQAGLSLSFSPDVVNLDARVSLEAKNLTVAAALTELLIDLRVDVVLSANGQLSVVRQPPRPVIGTIVGRVTDSTSKESVAGVTVSVAETRLSATTGNDGKYTLRAVPAGVHSITARKLGYSTQSRTATVGDNATATLDFVLVRAPTMLSEVVATATGGRARLEVGNSIGTIKADSLVQTELIRNMSDLLAARTPGVVVAAFNGLVGAPSFVRIRGQSGLFSPGPFSETLSNDPIIILDGMRLTPPSNKSGSVSIGGTGVAGDGSGGFASTNRLDDVDPNTIESIDILRGPSASSLYGTAAAAGVVVIKTKKGVAGSYRLNVLADYGISRVPGKFPLQYAGFGHLPDGTPTAECYRFQTPYGRTNVQERSCIMDSVVAYDPINNPRLSTLGTGTARNLSTSLSGGSERLQQYLSLRMSDAVGPGKLSAAETDRVARMWSAPAPSWVRRPNQETNIAGASRTSFRPVPGLDLSLTANGIYRNTLGLSPGGALIFGGLDAFPNGGQASLARKFYDTLVYLPAERQGTKGETVVKRGYATAGGTYTPPSLSWVVLRGTIGGDYTVRSGLRLNRASECTPVLNPGGCTSQRLTEGTETFVTTVDVGAQATWMPRSWLSLRTSTGEQLTRTKMYQLLALNTSSNLAFGTELLTPTPVSTAPGQQLFFVRENRDEAATAGWYLEETAALRERLFLTAAFRQDVASSFGFNVNDKRPPLYPKYSLSWLLSNEPFFPRTPWVSSLRLRTAYGHSGQAARQTAVLNTYITTSAFVDGELSPAVGMSRVGNADLLPERTAEVEGGFDLSLLETERVQLQATLYRKLSDDAIVGSFLPASAGINAGTGGRVNYRQITNLGRVENRGWEVAVTAKLLDRQAVAWDLTVNASRNTNRLVSSVATTSLPRVGGGNFVGYPLNSFLGHPIIGYSDVDGDGILQVNEVQVSPELQWMGSVNPERELSYTNAVRLWGGAVQMNATFDQVIGKSSDGSNVMGSTGIYDRRWFDKSVPLAEQAVTMQAVFNNAFFGKQNTVRFRELSVTGIVPQRIATRLLRARSAAVTLAGRNLALWTNSGHKDPDMTFGYDGPSVFDQFPRGVPPTRDVTFRISLGY